MNSNKINALKNLGLVCEAGGHNGINSKITSFLKFAEKYNLIEQADNTPPISIVWSVNKPHRSLFKYQIGQVFQNATFNPADFILFVCDEESYDMVYSFMEWAIESFNLGCCWSILSTTGNKGNTAFLNWETGLNSDKLDSDRVLFIKDDILFFDIITLIDSARKATTKNRLTNFSTILGNHIAPLTSEWVYMVHSKYAPTSLLNCWLADRKTIQNMGGFDIRFRRGAGYHGDLDFVMRWVAAGLNYYIEDEASVLRLPSIVRDEEEFNTLQRLSTSMIPYFTGKYPNLHIPDLSYPFVLDLNLLRVTDAKTFDPYSRINWENYLEKAPKLDEQVNINKPNLNLFIAE